MKRSQLDAVVRPYGLANAFFAVLVAVMAGHESEHVAQVLQKDALARNCARGDCRGLLGFIFDLEWIHFVYNASILAALVVLLVSYRLWERRWRDVAPLWTLFLLTGIAVQGYHVVEHTAKIVQWTSNGHVAPTPGLLGKPLGPPHGQNFSLIELHFAFNTVVFVLVLAGFFGLGIHRHALRGRIRHSPEAGSGPQRGGGRAAGETPLERAAGTSIGEIPV